MLSKLPAKVAAQRNWLAPLALAGLTLLVFWRVSHHEFLNYDDPDYVTNNPHVKEGLKRDAIRWAFTKLHGEATYWHPITWLSHMLDCDLFGLNPAAHHLINAIIHSLNVILLFALLNNVTGAFWRSLFVAAIFGLHPIQVDTVAWVAERKNVLSTIFLFSTLLFYARYARQPSWRSYLLTIGAYALGLMTKPMLVTVPGILVLLDFWPLRRFRFATPAHEPSRATTPVGNARLVAEKVPFLVMAIASAAVTLLSHKTLGMEHYSHGLPLSLRLANAVVSYVRYIGKIIWPHNLAVFYPHPGAWPIRAVTGSVLLLLVASFIAFRCWRRYPFVTMGWCWFLGTLVPVLGIVQAGYQAMADRFGYVPMIGLLIAATWGISEWIGSRFSPIPSNAVSRTITPATPLALIGSVAIAGCILTTSIQLGYWQNSETLWRHALAVTHNNFIAHHNLGHILTLQEKYDEALQHTSEALRLRPDLIESHYTLGCIKDRQHKYDEAIACYEKTLEMKWDWAEVHRALLTACYTAGHTNKAIAHLERLLKLAPENPGGHVELAQALTAENRLAEAVQHYQDAIRLNPNWPVPLNNLSWIFATAADDKLRKSAEAISLAQRACELTNWRAPLTIGTLAAAYAEHGEFEKAIELAEQARTLAEQGQNAELIARNDKLIALYRQKKPYHEPSR
jgi:protein O-mannosyl-transferase